MRMRFRSATRADYIRQSFIVLAALLHFALPQIPIVFGIGRDIGNSAGAQADAVPPGWAFSIWGVIFAWTLLFALWQAMPGKAKSSFLRACGWLAFASMALSAGWSIAAIFGPLWSTLPVMMALYACLALTAFTMRRRLENTVPAARWLAIYPFQLFFGWITLALPANLASIFVDYDLRPFDATADIQTLFVFAVAALLAYIGLRVTRAAPFYALAIAWGAGALLFDHAWVHWRPLPAMGSAALVLFLIAAERWISLSRRGGFER